MFDRCPWASIASDRFAGRALAAHAIATREWGAHFSIPGRSDPRLMEAFLVITSEHDRIDRERLDEAARKREAR